MILICIVGIIPDQCRDIDLVVLRSKTTLQMIERQKQTDIKFLKMSIFPNVCRPILTCFAIKNDGITLGQSENIELVILSQKNIASRDRKTNSDGD